MEPVRSDSEALTVNELDCLLVILKGLDDRVAQERLLDQVQILKVTERRAMHTELCVSSETLAVALPDGPLDIRATAFDSNGSPTGFVSVWLSEGRLSMMSFGWVTDDMPDDFPPARTLMMDD